jgi:hypothetical protein
MKVTRGGEIARVCKLVTAVSLSRTYLSLPIAHFMQHDCRMSPEHEWSSSDL